VPVGGHCRPIGFAIFGGSASILGDEPVKTLVEDCIRIYYPFLLVEEFECRQDEAEEGIDECGVHVDDAVACFEENHEFFFAVA